jgi:hypothetical protein
MKIRSRPLPSQPATIGNGFIDLKLTSEQLELISALVYNCRLGNGSVYKTAAFEIIGMIEDEYGTDFMDDASDNVDLQVTVEDDASNVVFSTTPGIHYITLEV